MAAGTAPIEIQIKLFFKILFIYCIIKKKPTVKDNIPEVNEIINNTAHDYFVENVLKEGYIKNISLKGSNFKKYLN